MKLAFLFFAALLTLQAEPEYPKRGPDIYDPKADGQALIDAAVLKAGAGHKRVLVDFGANWCIWCHRLHATFENDPQVAAALQRDYEVVMVDVNTRNGTQRNAAVNQRYGNPIKEGLPVLVVLDEHGRIVTTQESGALEQGEGHSPAKITAFLAKWAVRR